MTLQDNLGAQLGARQADPRLSGIIKLAILAVGGQGGGVLTGWIAGEPLPEGLSLGEECELKDAMEGGAVVKCQNQELQSDEIAKHLEAGKQVTKLALVLDDHVSFVLGEDLIVRKLKFLDGAVDQLENTEHDDLRA